MLMIGLLVTASYDRAVPGTDAVVNTWSMTLLPLGSLSEGLELGSTPRSSWPRCSCSWSSHSSTAGSARRPGADDHRPGRARPAADHPG
ncbi:hypothetical protein HBB16_15410 [Pseudonocardia sp. MCCB 268]|nr:hypothetical protein [Pseudonocardia cytotoxica]